MIGNTELRCAAIFFACRNDSALSEQFPVRILSFWKRDRIWLCVLSECPGKRK